MRRKKRGEPVSASERRKAAFLNEYRELCEKHCMAVVMNDDNDGHGMYFLVAQILDVNFLDRAIEEMQINYVAYLEPRGKQ